jgi:hypothetical protein
VEDKTIELSEEQKSLYKATAQTLKGHERRVFMARVVKVLGRGRPWQAQQDLGWDRDTIRKGRHELASGIPCLDNDGARGRQRAEERLPCWWTSQQLSMDKAKPNRVLRVLGSIRV